MLRKGESTEKRQDLRTVNPQGLPGGGGLDCSLLREEGLDGQEGRNRKTAQAVRKQVIYEEKNPPDWSNHDPKVTPNPSCYM